MAEFKPWPNISNIDDKIVVTEMIDGAGAFAIHIERLKFDAATGTLEIRPGDVLDFYKGNMVFYRLTAQSKTRLITPRDDNHGFAKWVAENASGLASTLGEGIHYGEWWGYKINRGYDLGKGDKRFSLFNTERWAHVDGTQVPRLYSVPVLAEGSLFAETDNDGYTPIHEAVDHLRYNGSEAAIGYMKPEGIVVFHTGGRVMFKYKLDYIEPEKTKFRIAQEEELTRIERAAKLDRDFDVSKAYADAVATAIKDYPTSGF